MSELSFNVLDNNAEFQKETQQLHEAISGLESDLEALYAGAENSIKGVEQLITRRSGCSSSAAFEYKDLQIRFISFL